MAKRSNLCAVLFGNDGTQHLRGGFIQTERGSTYAVTSLGMKKGATLVRFCSGMMEGSICPAVSLGMAEGSSTGVVVSFGPTDAAASWVKSSSMVRVADNSAQGMG